MHIRARRRPPVRFAPALGAVALLAALGAGCGDDPSGPAGRAEREVGPEGDTVETDDGQARVVVPAGALDAPLRIRIRRLPADSLPPALASRTRVSQAYRFSPDGFTFRRPVEVQLFFDDAGLPPGVGLEDLTIGKVDAEGQLQELDDIRLLPGPSRGRVALHAVRGIGGTVSSFSPFAVWVADSAGSLEVTPSTTGDDCL